MGTTLLTFSAFGSYQLSDGKPLLDHVLCLDPFSECGRYVEADGDKTVLDMVIEKRGPWACSSSAPSCGPSTPMLTTTFSK